MIVNVKQDFGAIGDGVADDTRAFGNALASLRTSGGGTCVVPEGRYMIAPSGVPAGAWPVGAVADNVHLIGQGEAVLAIAAMPTNNFLKGTGDRWSMEKLTFDMGDLIPSTGLSCISAEGTNWVIKHCNILRSGKNGILVKGGINWLLKKNFIQVTVPSARPSCTGIIATTDTLNGNWPDRGQILENVLEGTGLNMSGTGGVCSRNRINGSGIGTGIFGIGPGGKGRATVFSENICTNGICGFDDTQNGAWWCVNGMEIWTPDAVIINNVAYGNGGAGICFGGANSTVTGNLTYDNGNGKNPDGTPKRGGGGLVARSMPTGNASGSIIVGNRSFDSQGVNGTQDYGFIRQSADITGLIFGVNNWTGNRVAATHGL